LKAESRKQKAERRNQKSGRGALTKVLLSAFVISAFGRAAPLLSALVISAFGTLSSSRLRLPSVILSLSLPP
jgi:hypothetical protein